MAGSATGIEAGRAYLRLLLDSKEAEDAMRRYESRAESMGRVLTALGTRLGALSGAMTAPFLYSIRVASSAQQTLQKFQQTFREQSKAAQDFANNYTGALITTQRVTQNTLADIYNQFLGLGASRDVALEYAKALTQAAADFESFQNLEPGDSIRRISSALAGEIEPLRRFGVDVSDQQIDRRLKAQGVVGGTRSVDFLEKGLLRAQIILDTLEKQNVLGDVGRTFDQAENQIRGFRRAVDEAAVQVGTSFIPIIEASTPTLIAIVEAMGDFAAANPLLVTSLGGAAVTITAVSAAAVFMGLTLTNVGVIAGFVSRALEKMNAANAAGAVASQGRQAYSLAEAFAYEAVAKSAVEAAAGHSAATAALASATTASSAWSTATAVVVAEMPTIVTGLAAEAAGWTSVAGAISAATVALLAYQQAQITGAVLGTPRIPTFRGVPIGPSGPLLLPGPGPKALPGPKGGLAASGSLDDIASIRTEWVRTYDAAGDGARGFNATSQATAASVKLLGQSVSQTARQGTTMRGAFVAAGQTLATWFPTVILLATNFKATFAAMQTAIIGFAKGALAYLVTQLTPLAGVLGLVAAAAGYLAYEMWLTSKAQDAAEASAKKAEAALLRLREAVRESLAGPDSDDVAKRIDDAAAAAKRYADVLASVAEERRQLRALEEAGRGDSDEANNLRGRVNAQENALPALEEQAKKTAAIADPAKQSREALNALQVAVSKYGESIKELNAAGDDPDRFLPPLARVRGAREAIDERFKLGDPAIQTLATALTDEVIGGTAKDPQARLAEIKLQIKSFQDFYEDLQGSSDETIADYAKQQLDRFRKLSEEVQNAIPSAIGGRDKPVIPGTEEGDKDLEREAQKRADTEAEALSRARASQNDLIEDDLQKRLAEIQQQREESLAAATKAGATPVAINAINDQFDNEAELARRDAAKKAEEQTARLKLESDIAALQANPEITEAEKRIRELKLRAESDLKAAGLTDTDRDLIARRRDSDIAGVIADEQDRLENEDRRRRDQRRRLDISDVFTGSVATALAIGPPISLEQQQLNVSKETLAAIRRLRDIAEEKEDGIPGI